MMPILPFTPPAVHVIWSHRTLSGKCNEVGTSTLSMSWCRSNSHATPIGITPDTGVLAMLLQRDMFSLRAVYVLTYSTVAGSDNDLVRTSLSLHILWYCLTLVCHVYCSNVIADVLLVSLVTGHYSVSPNHLHIRNPKPSLFTSVVTTSSSNNNPMSCLGL